MTKIRGFVPALCAAVAAWAASSVQAQTGPDVIVGDLYDLGSYGTVTVSGEVIRAYAVGTISCNIGNTPLLWISNTNQHPVIAQNLFRLKNGRMEQLGQSWLKHGFTALQGTVCGTCTAWSNGTRLGVGCSDPYSASLNGGQGGGPKWQVNAATGVFTYPHAGGGTAPNVVWRRLQAKESELNNAGAIYFVEGQYVTQDDAASGNKNNNCSYRRVTFNGSMGLQLQDSTQRTKPAIQAWQDHGGGVGVADANIQLVNLDVPGDGRLILGAHATQNQDGTWHYEFAVQNISSDRAARTFTVPLPSHAAVTNIGFHDVAYTDGEKQGGTDWTASVSGTDITWATAAYSGTEASGGNEYSANALRWGTLYNFYFDVNASPATGVVDVGMFKPGTPTSIAGAVLVPTIVGDGAPINDSCATAITRTDGTSSFTTVGATTDGPSETACATAGTLCQNDIWYRYTAGCAGDVTVSLCGSAFDTKVIVYAGSCPTGPNTAVACNEDSCGTASSVTFAATGGQQYLVRIGSASGQTGNGTVTFTGPSCGPVPPANNACASAVPMADGQSYPGTTVNATNDGTANCGQSSTSADVWYSYRPNVTGSVTFSTCGAASFDTVVSVHSGSCGALTQIGCVDDTTGCGNATRVTVTLTANVTYRVRVAGYQGQTGTFTLTVTGGGGTVDTPPVNNDCANRAGINDGSSAFTTLGAGTDGPAHACFAGDQQVSNDIWFNYPSQITGTLTISVCDADFDTRMAVYSGAGCADFASRLLACNDDSCGTGSTITLSVLAGSHYTIRLGGASAAARGSGHISLLSNPTDLHLCSFVSTTALPGPINAANEDIVAYNTTTGVWSVVFDGSDLGLGSLAIDAIAVLPSDEILLSFTADVSVPGLVNGPNGTLVDDSDIVKFTPTTLGTTTAGTLSFYFDGSDVGLDPANNSYDIDALSVDSSGRLYVSTLGTTTVPVPPKVLDEDVLIFTPTSLGATTAGSWAFYIDGSDIDLATTADEDIDAFSFDGLTPLLSTFGPFAVPGVSGTGQDVVKFTPTSTGATTAGAYSMFATLASIGVPATARLTAYEYTTDPLSGVNFSTRGDAPLATCPADFNADGIADSGDYFDFLAMFFNGQADQDRSGETDSEDYFRFVEDYSAGCP